MAPNLDDLADDAVAAAVLDAADQYYQQFYEKELGARSENDKAYGEALIHQILTSGHLDRVRDNLRIFGLAGKDLRMMRES